MTILIFVCSFIFGYILGKDDMLSKILEKNPDFFLDKDLTIERHPYRYK